MITSTVCAPDIANLIDPNLLSIPMFRHDAEYILKIANYLLLKIVNRKFRKFPKRVEKLLEDHARLMELYGRAKDKEGQIKDEKGVKTRMPFYRFELPNRVDQSIFKRLERKRADSIHDRQHYAIQKIRQGGLR